MWLLPFYPSPDRDNGYDITDDYNVDSRLGTLGDFVIFMREAKERGIRVLIDLVVNHTSNQHPVVSGSAGGTGALALPRFLRLGARTSPRTPATRSFPGEQDSIWEFDPEAEAYFLHRFYKHQPDLNIANPSVRHEICKIMGFWLELGVSGFRIDAVPFIVEHLDPKKRETAQFRNTCGSSATSSPGVAAMPSCWPRPTSPPPKPWSISATAINAHDLNFLVNQAYFLAIVRQNPRPLLQAMRKLPPLPGSRTVGPFSPGTMTKWTSVACRRRERQEVFAEMGPKPEMQLYKRGIPAGSAPNVKRRPEAPHSRVRSGFTLPGTPVLWSGEEIGMGDDLSLNERESVRTPMQWSPHENGGFSSAASRQARPSCRERRKIRLQKGERGEAAGAINDRC